MPPPPMPCSARAAISAGMLGASAQATEPDEEDDDRHQHHPPPAVDVGELAEQRRHRGGGQEIGGHHPATVLDVGERAPDGRQRRRDDGLLQRREEHRQQDADHDGADGGVIERRGVPRRG